MATKYFSARMVNLTDSREITGVVTVRARSVREATTGASHQGVAVPNRGGTGPKGIPVYANNDAVKDVAPATPAAIAHLQGTGKDAVRLPEHLATAEDAHITAHAQGKTFGDNSDRERHIIEGRRDYNKQAHGSVDEPRDDHGRWTR